MKRILRRVGLATVAAGLVSLAAGQARATNIAYINATGGTVNYLNAYGINVTYIDNPTSLTLGDLAGYDAIMIASNSIFSNPTNIGNVAADFADTGRGVVLTEFDFQGQWALGGRIMTDGYTPFGVDPLSSGYAHSTTIGTVQDPGSPILAGVNTALLTSQFQANSPLTAGAHPVADWANGLHAIGYNSLAHSSVVGLNLFPDAGFDGGNAENQKLIANAIEFSLHGVSAVPEPSTLASGATAGLIGLALAWRRRRAA